MFLHIWRDVPESAGVAGDGFSGGAGRFRFEACAPAKSVSVELTCRDGSVSEIKSFQR
jgi:hypothetical protein